MQRWSCHLAHPRRNGPDAPTGGSNRKGLVVSAANTSNAAGGDVSVPGHDEARQTPIIPEMRRQLSEPLPAGKAPGSGHRDGSRPTTDTPPIGDMRQSAGA